MRLYQWLMVAGLLAGAQAAEAASLNCVPSAAPLMVRTEGLTERVGDIVLNCTEGTPNATVTGTLLVTMPAQVTNRLGADDVIDATLTADNGSGPASAGATPALGGQYTVAFEGASFTLSPAGAVSLRISNLRIAVPALGGNTQSIAATLSWAGGTADLLFQGAQVTVAVPRPSLRSASVSTLINCYGSRLPATITVPTLLSTGTARSVTRVTEGYWTAFGTREAGADSGTRFLISYSGFPAGARLFVPDAVAGSDAAEPTSSGLMGHNGAAGAHTAGSRTLLLVRIDGAAADGSGGTPLYTPPGSGTAALTGASEVHLVEGAAQVVYEVADANPQTIESAEIPTWMGLDQTGGAQSAPKQSILLAPVSDVARATAEDPVPRFIATEPESDCASRGDCASFPKLDVRTPVLEFTAESGSAGTGTWISVGNTGGGTLSWTAYITYTNGTGWASAGITRGAAGGWLLRLGVTPLSLYPGIYQATLTVDAGPAGVRNFPVKLTVTAVSGGAAVPQVNAIVHAATFANGGVVPGSLITLWGLRMGGQKVTVTFDTLAATLLYTSDKQINLEVPAALAGKKTATITVTADGRSSKPQAVNVSAMSPGIFANGILNQDNALNSAAQPAAGGSVIQIFATGLPPAGIATVTAKIHDVWITSPEYAGPAPGLIGVQQVNLRVPEGWGRMATTVTLCTTSVTTGIRFCSPEVPLNLK
ncbi:MAG TPA: hypothetical protein VHA11_13385 [Bryobacteraceae bacterium]|nr:hypothetical protein [Bryobacteraceae bacterium]